MKVLGDTSPKFHAEAGKQAIATNPSVGRYVINSDAQGSIPGSAPDMVPIRPKQHIMAIIISRARAGVRLPDRRLLKRFLMVDDYSLAPTIRRV